MVFPAFAVIGVCHFGGVALCLIAVTAFIIIKTPIRNYLPGYLDVEVRKEIMQNAFAGGFVGAYDGDSGPFVSG